MIQQHWYGWGRLVCAMMYKRVMFPRSLIKQSNSLLVLTVVSSSVFSYLWLYDLLSVRFIQIIKCSILSSSMELQVEAEFVCSCTSGMGQLCEGSVKDTGSDIFHSPASARDGVLLGLSHSLACWVTCEEQIFLKYCIHGSFGWAGISNLAPA